MSCQPLDTIAKGMRSMGLTRFLVTPLLCDCIKLKKKGVEVATLKDSYDQLNRSSKNRNTLMANQPTPTPPKNPPPNGKGDFWQRWKIPIISIVLSLFL